MSGHSRASAGATLYVAFLAAPMGEARHWLSSSDAGSGLPWWSPIAVTAILLIISFIYRMKHRPAPPADQLFDGETEHPGAHASKNGDPKSFFWRRFVIGEHRKPRQV